MGRRSAHDRPETAHSSRQSGQHVEGRRGAERLLGRIAQRSRGARQAWFRGTTKLEQHHARLAILRFFIFRTQLQEERSVEPVVRR